MDEHALRNLDAAMVRLADGDRTACPVVFDLLWGELVRFAERAVGPGADAHDAAQQALVKIFEQAANYDLERSALAWALALTAWECRTTLQRRRRRREDALDYADTVQSSTPNPEEVAEQSAMSAALRTCLAGLSESDQKTLEEAFLLESDGPHAPAFRKRKERALHHVRLAWKKFYGT
jgi:RNA polymerase sigma factor (sigma-70 family)